MSGAPEDRITKATLASIEATPDARLKQILTALVRHLHGFVRDVEPSEEEWLRAIAFLTETGRMCDDKRQEFILLSDTLGATMLIDAINHRAVDGATESSVLGPFHRDAAPAIEQMDSISGDTPGEPVIVRGGVRSQDGAPIAGALLDIWHGGPNGLYENQDPSQPDFNLRGRLLSDADGRYAFRTVKPSSYPVPHDGPVGKLLRATGRHPYRPAHIHFIVSADGYAPITTQLFTRGDSYLDSDAVFGVKDSLVVDYVRHDSDAEAAELGVDAPFYTVDYDFGLKPAT